MAGFAVIDVETTGFSPRLHDRVVEIAVVQLDAGGERQGEWSTLVNPERDLGAQHVHGITAADARLAPRFEQIAPYVVELVSGRAIVAHNASFDVRFLEAELDRAGMPRTFPREVCLCTMRLANRYIERAPRGLAICCEMVGVEHTGAHSALGDARATSELFRAYRAHEPSSPRWAEAQRAAEQAGRVAGGAGGASGASGTGGAGAARAVAAFGAPGTAGADPVPPPSVTRGASSPTHHWLSALADRLDRVDDAGCADDYLAMLDVALLDRHLSASDRESLLACAEDLGLTRGQVEQLHHGYLDALARIAWSDGFLSDQELDDLHTVADQLGLDVDDVEAAISTAQAGAAQDAVAQASTAEGGGGHGAGSDAVSPGTIGTDAIASHVTGPGAFHLEQGDAVVLTGSMSRPRAQWEAELVAHGLVPKGNMSKAVRLLVAADPDSLSGKARAARRLGIPIVTEDALAGLLTVA